MKLFIAILSFIFVFLPGYGQVVAIQNISGVHLYVCDYNHLKVAVEKLPVKRYSTGN